MEDDFPKSPFYKGMMTGLFAGIIVTLICLVFNYVYRIYSGFSLSGLINISSLIFFTNFVFLMFGIAYYALKDHFKKGEIFFVAVMALLTIISAWAAEYIHRTKDIVQNIEFRHLLIGLILIMGVGAAVLVPFLYHNKRFQDYVI